MITNKTIQNIIDKYIQEIVNQPLPISPFQKNKSINEITTQILNILIGTSRTTRLGPKPSSSTLKIIGEKIQQKIQNELPLNIPACFGSKKTWGLCQPGIDIAELFTILQLVSINRRVMNIYPPGINFTLYIGDAWYEYIYNEDIGIKEYREGLQKLINLYSNLNVKLISMYSFHEDNSILYDICDQNLELLLNYWKESSNTDENNWKYLKSYKILKSIGWVGEIPNIMRIHYLNKMDRYLENNKSITKIEAVLKYFSYGLMLNQHDLIKRKNPDDCTLEISLMSPPPGIPVRLRGDRLYLRCLPTQISSRGAPCWPVMGILKLDEQGLICPAILSPRDWNRDNTFFVDMYEYFIDHKSNFKINVPLYKNVSHDKRIAV